MHAPHAYTLTIGMLTEFGAVSGLEQSGIDDINFVTGLSDEFIQSWSYWQVGCSCVASNADCNGTSQCMLTCCQY